MKKRERDDQKEEKKMKRRLLDNVNFELEQVDISIHITYHK